MDSPLLTEALSSVSRVERDKKDVLVRSKKNRFENYVLKLKVNFPFHRARVKPLSY